MRHYLLCVALLSTTVEAQIAPCGSATCVGDNPGDVKLGGTVLETRGAYADGGQAILQPVVPGASLVLRSQQSTGTSARPDVIIQAPNKHDGGTILSVRNGTSEIMSVSPAGVVTATSFSGPQAATLGAFAYVDAGVVNASRVEFVKSNPYAPVLYDLDVAPGYLHLDGGIDVSGPINLRNSNSISCGTSGSQTLGIECSTGKIAPANGDSCTLQDGTNLSSCTVTVTAGAKCVCAPVGTTAAIAAGGCAVSLSSTTLTVTGPDNGNYDVNVWCDK